MIGRADVRRRLVKAFVVAPLAAPIVYWAATLLVSLFDRERTLPSAATAATALALVVAGGAPVAYAAALVAVAPALWMLRAGRAWTWAGVPALGAVVGAAAARLCEPLLRGELVSVPLAPWHGAALGALAAGLFARLSGLANRPRAGA